MNTHVGAYRAPQPATRPAHAPPVCDLLPYGRVEFHDVSAFDGERRRFAPVSFVAEPGMRVALLAQDAASASALLDCLVGVHTGGPVTGLILVDGIAPATEDEWARRRSTVAHVPRGRVAGRFPLPVADLVESCRAPEAARAAARELDLDPLMDRPLDTLTDDAVQRAFLARAAGAVAAGATVLAVDGPAASPPVLDLIASLAVTTIVAGTDHTVAARADRIVAVG